jgi:hypothetical protein
MMTSIPLPNCDLLLEELKKLEPELQLHYPPGPRRKDAALRNIKSVFLASNIFPISGQKIIPPIRHPKINLLSTAAELLGKTVDDIHYAYYAIIPPKSEIYPHVDISPYFETVDRYQIFFKLTPDQEIVQEGSHAISNSIVWFNPSMTHAFSNNSISETWHFVVFDIYKTINNKE